LREVQRSKLNLGCGDDYKDGYVNLDWNKNARADLYHNLNQIPYPFPDNTFDEIEFLFSPIKGEPA